MSCLLLPIQFIAAASRPRAVADRGYTVGASRVKGDLSLHTDRSDGGNTLAEMAEAAPARGYQYLAVTDHSQSLKGSDISSPLAYNERQIGHPCGRPTFAP